MTRDKTFSPAVDYFRWWPDPILLPLDLKVEKSFWFDLSGFVQISTSVSVYKLFCSQNKWQMSNVFLCNMVKMLKIILPFIIILLFWSCLLLLTEEYDHTEKNHLERTFKTIHPATKASKIQSQLKQVKCKEWQLKKAPPQRQCHRK